MREKKNQKGPHIGEYQIVQKNEEETPKLKSNRHEK